MSKYFSTFACGSDCKDCNALEKEIKQLKAELKDAYMTLQYYADRWTYFTKHHDGSRTLNLSKFIDLDSDIEYIIETVNGEEIKYNFKSPGMKARAFLNKTKK